MVEATVLEVVLMTDTVPATGVDDVGLGRWG